MRDGICSWVRIWGSVRCRLRFLGDRCFDFDVGHSEDLPGVDDVRVGEIVRLRNLGVPVRISIFAVGDLPQGITVLDRVLLVLRDLLCLRSGVGVGMSGCGH